jgi:adenylate kinase
MTWFNTPPKFEKEPVDGEEPDPEEAEEPEEEEEEAPAEDDDPDKPKPPKVVFYKESDNHMRVPHERFFKHKNLETLALSAPKTQPLLKVHILCCGIRYGHGEGIFYDHFRSAWKQSPAKLPIVGAGDNLIPTLHVRDLSRCVKKLIDDNIDKPYLFAVDKTKKPT